MGSKEQTQKIVVLIIWAAIGAVLGFSVFLLTENIIFLIVFVTVSLTLGIAITDRPQDEKEG